MVVVGVIIAMLCGSVGAAEIWARNVSYTEGSGYDQLAKTKLLTGVNYNERFIPSERDEPHLDDPTHDLDIYSREPNDPSLIGVNRKRYNTPGWDVYLEADISITGPMSNDFEIYVNNDTDLEYRRLIAYDTANPNTVYEFETSEESFGFVSLNPIQNQLAGVYAHWRVETPPLVQGDIASSSGIGILDGTVDLYDLQALASLWLDETLTGDNYSWGDIDYDRKNNIEDFAIVANHWLE